MGGNKRKSRTESVATVGSLDDPREEHEGQTSGENNIKQSCHRILTVPDLKLSLPCARNRLVWAVPLGTGCQQHLKKK